MSATLSAQQETLLLASVSLRRHLDVAATAVVTKLMVLVDARSAAVREVATSRLSAALAAEVGACGHTRLAASTHGHERAVEVLEEIRHRRDQGHRFGPRGVQVVVAADSDPDGAAEVLARHPHSALVVAVALCDGSAFAARWS